MTATNRIEVSRDNLPLSAPLLDLSGTYHFQEENDTRHFGHKNVAGV